MTAANGHEHEELPDDPGMGGGHTQYARPREARAGHASREPPDELDACQRNITRGDGEALELVEHVVAGIVPDVGTDDSLPRPSRIDDAHLRGARERVQAWGDPCHRLGVSEQLQVEHGERSTPHCRATGAGSASTAASLRWP